jgi:hypothetical protein
MKIADFEIFRVVSHIPKFGGDAASLVEDAASLIGDAASLVGDAASLVGDAASLIGDATSLVGDAVPLVGDAASLAGDTVSSKFWISDTAMNIQMITFLFRCCLSNRKTYNISSY